MNEPAYSTFLNPLAGKPVETEANIKMEGTEDGTAPTSEESPARKPWMKRAGAPVAKVASDVKRRRKNYQARRLLVPKNPLMILNELSPNVSFDFEELSPTGYFQASVELDGQVFFGKGTSKKQAQQDAAEVALRGFYFEKLLDQFVRNPEDVDVKDVSQSQPQSQPQPETETQPQPQSQPLPQPQPEATPPTQPQTQPLSQPQSQSTDGQADGATRYAHLLEDETPWAGLASLAMYKLVTLWQSTPSEAPVPVTKYTGPSKPSITDSIGKLPPNATDMDPVMLLNQISPNSKFAEDTRDVRNGNIMFTFTVNFNGGKYSGTASKKKVAKKLCAKEALLSIGVVCNENNSNN